MSEKNYADFVRDEAFVRWVLTPTAGDEAFWEAYLHRHPEQAEDIRQARQYVRNLSVAARPAIPAGEAGLIWESLEEKLKVRPLRRWVVLARVAVLLLLLGGAGVFSYYRLRSTGREGYGRMAPDRDLTEVVNTTPQSKRVELPDRSVVVLEPNSKLSYNARFEGDKREVYLAGEAFFEVTKNPEKPFLVYSDYVVTRVIGTSFTIRAFPDKQVVVSVRTGKVTVFSRKKQGTSQEMILTPNQEAVFPSAEEEVIRKLVQAPRQIITPEQFSDFRFEETPLSTVFTTLENAYGIRITYDPDVLKHCNLTSDLSGESLFQQLNLICEAIHARYELTDGQVVIYGKGCD